MVDVSRDIGSLDARVSGLEKTCDEMREDIKAILGHVEAAKGGWRVISTLAVVTSALGAGVATLVGWIHKS